MWQRSVHGWRTFFTLSHLSVRLLLSCLVRVSSSFARADKSPLDVLQKYLRKFYSVICIFAYCIPHRPQTLNHAGGTPAWTLAKSQQKWINRHKEDTSFHRQRKIWRLSNYNALNRERNRPTGSVNMKSVFVTMVWLPFHVALPRVYFRTTSDRTPKSIIWGTADQHGFLKTD